MLVLSWAEIASVDLAFIFVPFHPILSSFRSHFFSTLSRSWGCLVAKQACILLRLSSLWLHATAVWYASKNVVARCGEKPYSQRKIHWSYLFKDGACIKCVNPSSTSPKAFKTPNHHIAHSMAAVMSTESGADQMLLRVPSSEDGSSSQGCCFCLVKFWLNFGKQLTCASVLEQLRRRLTYVFSHAGSLRWTHFCFGGL